MKAAFSKVNITPREYLGKALAGYTRKNQCLGKLDDIHTYGVLFEANSPSKKKNYVLLISVDTLKIPSSIANYIKNKLLNKFPTLNKAKILIHATHTHSSLDLTGEFYWPGGYFNVIKGIMFGMNRNDKYIIWFTSQIVKMVNNLFKNLETCKIAWIKKEFNPKIVINRRNPKRNIPLGLGIIAFRDFKTDQIIGCIINYACHPTTLSFKNYKLSADYPGRIVSRIDELTNGKIHAIYFNGPSGDLNPITTCGTDFDKLLLEKNLIYEQLGTYKDTKRIGYIIAEEVLRLISNFTEEDFFDDIKIQNFSKKFWIPMKDHKYFSKKWFTNKLIYMIKKHFILRIAKPKILRANFPIFILKGKNLKLKCKSLVQYIEIQATSKYKSKNFSLITIPGELFVSIGSNLLKNSPTGDATFIFQNTQDWIAYLFPLEEYTKEGGYEAIPSFSPLCGYYVEHEVLSLLTQVKSKSFFD